MSIEMLEAAKSAYAELSAQRQGAQEPGFVALRRRARSWLTNPRTPDAVRAASLQLLVYPARIKAFKPAGRCPYERLADDFAHATREPAAGRRCDPERYVGKHPALAAPYGKDVPPSGMAALQQIATELRRRTAGPPMPKPVLGVELHEWADRIEAAMKEIGNG